MSAQETPGAKSHPAYDFLCRIRRLNGRDRPFPTNGNFEFDTVLTRPPARVTVWPPR
jgi:hypothetical protein